MHNLTVVNNSVRECNYLSEVAAAVMLHGDGDNPVNQYERCPRQGTILNTIAPNQYIDDSEAVRLCGVKFIDVYDISHTLWESWSAAVATTFENVSFKSMTGARCIEGKIEKEGIKMGSREGTIQSCYDMQSISLSHSTETTLMERCKYFLKSHTLPF